MAYDDGAAERLRELFRDDHEITEKKMFGGLVFMFEGHMFMGVVGERLMARIGPEKYEDALSRPHIREMDFSGRPMKGYVYIDPPGFESDSDLELWAGACLEFARSLPPKRI